MALMQSPWAAKGVQDLGFVTKLTWQKKNQTFSHQACVELLCSSQTAKASFDPKSKGHTPHAKVMRAKVYFTYPSTCRWMPKALSSSSASTPRRTADSNTGST